MNYRKNYPLVSVFITEVYPLSKESLNSEENVTADTTLEVLAHSKISESTRKKSLDFAHELIKYFTSNLLLHHHQDDVPIFTIYLGVSENQVNINTHGGYYTKFIQSIPSLQNILDELLILAKEDLNIDHNNIEDIVMDLESMPRLDIRNNLSNGRTDDGEDSEDLNWSCTRIIRTPYSESYALYLNEESAGEIHLHIGKDIDSTIITTVNITEKEKAQLMGYVHETLLESLEEEYKTKSTIKFYSEAVEDI